MKKIVINNCYGGFGVSKEVYDYLGLEWDGYGYFTGKPIGRDDPKLVEAVEKLGSKKASGFCANLKIVEIPDDVDWNIEEYDGMEWIAEEHRTWY